MDGDSPVAEGCLGGPSAASAPWTPHPASSKSSSSLLLGVNRSKSRPGSCRTTSFGAPNIEDLAPGHVLLRDFDPDFDLGQ